MNLFLKKNISLLLILTILTPSIILSVPQKTRAAEPVIDSANLVKNIYTGTQTALIAARSYLAVNKELVLDPLAYAAARILIRQLTQSIVNWINTGFEGSPSFIQNPQAFLAGTADRAIGEFIFGQDLAFLCDPFKLNVKLSLGLQYSPFQDQINCTFSDVLQNIEGAYDNFTGGDFIGGGGWDSWISINANPQNNQMGALVFAQNELDARINSKIQAVKEEVNWGNGILSYKECEEITTDGEGQVIGRNTYRGDSSTRPSADLVGGRDYSASPTYTTTNCSTVTPGSLINKQMQAATGSDLTQLQLADEFNEIVGALANYLVTSVMQGGLLGSSSNQSNNNDARWRQDLNIMQNEQNASLGGIYSNAGSGMSESDSLLFSSSTISTTTSTTPN